MIQNRTTTQGAWIVLVSSAVLAPVSALALPVIPGSAGFGIDSTAGRGGNVIRVTNLNDSGSGSLRACVDAGGPRTCVFEVAGMITLSDDLEISNGDVRIAGQTAPSPGITLRGAGLLVTASNVLVQHIRVRVGDDPSGPAPDNRDALRIEAPAPRVISNIVIDHCTFSWSVDEIASVWSGAHDISLLNNIFAEPLNDSLHPNGSGGTEPHGFGVILGPSDGGVYNVSLVGNLMAHQLARNPLAYSSFAMVNNVVYNYGDSGVEVANLGGTSQSSIVGNVFLRGPNSTSSQPIFIRGASNNSTLLSGSKLYLADNSTGAAAADQWLLAYVEQPVTKSLVSMLSAPLWPNGLVALPTANSGVLNSVLAQSGARPADRDSADTRVINGVRTRGGSFINCVSADGSQRCQKNAGGWPAAPTRTRVLQLPPNPNQVNSDGYTNLEKWLHDMSAQVEGRSEVPTPPVNAKLL
jgi:hypothetical protein